MVELNGRLIESLQLYNVLMQELPQTVTQTGYMSTPQVGYYIILLLFAETLGTPVSGEFQSMHARNRSLIMKLPSQWLFLSFLCADCALQKTGSQFRRPSETSRWNVQITVAICAQCNRVLVALGWQPVLVCGLKAVWSPAVEEQSTSRNGGNFEVR
jgi:hypothetical protein